MKKLADFRETGDSGFCERKIWEWKFHIMYEQSYGLENSMAVNDYFAQAMGLLHKYNCPVYYPGCYGKTNGTGGVPV
jgi:hypothetical protein